MQNMMETVVSLGGMISGEHGIGLAKNPVPAHPTQSGAK